jgi:hypothetical protein
MIRGNQEAAAEVRRGLAEVAWGVCKREKPFQRNRWAWLAEGAFVRRWSRIPALGLCLGGREPPLSHQDWPLPLSLLQICPSPEQSLLRESWHQTARMASVGHG